ncbi:hypothetical protein IQ06DRAFT_129919 [Phaeosphaeriaceae sp. SRC1lsM3a]|nr:hypothetical protein IQ06DRAFT_129919 [Stagonospora sp. SRC1lsM3a]
MSFCIHCVHLARRGRESRFAIRLRIIPSGPSTRPFILSSSTVLLVYILLLLQVFGVFHLFQPPTSVTRDILESAGHYQHTLIDRG